MKDIVVTVVVPWYKERLTRDEENSIAALHHFLGNLPIVYLIPQGLAVPENRYGATLVHVSGDMLRSVASYSRMLLSREFYERFLTSEYILVYQLDAMVFSSAIDKWNNIGFDYIGAPLLKVRSCPQKGFNRVGNGGLSLRRVKAFIDTLSGPESAILPVLRALFCRLPDIECMGYVERMRQRFRIARGISVGLSKYVATYSCNEDLFWSDRARLFNPRFRIAPVDVAVGFSFDANPRLCYEMNKRRLPFGCHAWAKWDRGFWEPYLLKD